MTVSICQAPQRQDQRARRSRNLAGRTRCSPREHNARSLPLPTSAPCTPRRGVPTAAGDKRAMRRPRRGVGHGLDDRFGGGSINWVRTTLPIAFRGNESTTAQRSGTLYAASCAARACRRSSTAGQRSAVDHPPPSQSSGTPSTRDSGRSSRRSTPLPGRHWRRRARSARHPSRSSTANLLDNRPRNHSLLLGSTIDIAPPQPDVRRRRPVRRPGRHPVRHR